MPYYSLAAAAAILVVSFVTGLVARRIVLNRLGRLADMTASRFDDVIVASLRGPLPLWSLPDTGVVLVEVTQALPAQDFDALALAADTWARRRS